MSRSAYRDPAKRCEASSLESAWLDVKPDVAGKTGKLQELRAIIR